MKIERPKSTKVKFPEKWSFPEKMFVARNLKTKNVKDALEISVLLRMAKAKGFKNITKDNLRNFIANNEARIKTKLGYPTSNERKGTKSLNRRYDK